MKTLHDLFVHDLQDIHYAENELLDALDELAEQTEDEAISQAFEDHREETEQQLERLEEVFEMVGEEPEGEKCEGIEGLLTEHEEFVDMDPDQQLLDLHNLVAGQKTEHYEITAYGNLALIAERLGETEAGDLLHETLEEEQAALEKLSGLTDDFEYDEVLEAGAAD